VTELLHEHGQNRQARLAQRSLAEELTELVHGETGRVQATNISAYLFEGQALPSGSFSSEMVTKELQNAFEGVPQVTIPAASLEQGVGILDFAVLTKACGSKSQARKLVKGGGLYVNNVRVEAINRTINMSDFQPNPFCLVRVGKNKQFLVFQEL